MVKFELARSQANGLSLLYSKKVNVVAASHSRFRSVGFIFIKFIFFVHHKNLIILIILISYHLLIIITVPGSPSAALRRSILERTCQLRFGTFLVLACHFKERHFLRCDSLRHIYSRRFQKNLQTSRTYSAGNSPTVPSGSWPLHQPCSSTSSRRMIFKPATRFSSSSSKAS